MSGDGALTAPDFCIIAGCRNERHWPEGERADYPYCLAHLPASARAALRLPAPTSPGFAALAATLGEPISNPPTVAEQLAVYRLARDITQDALAAQAGVRRATVADIESARGDGANPKIGTVQALATALDVTIYIFSSTGP